MKEFSRLFGRVTGKWDKTSRSWLCLNAVEVITDNNTLEEVSTLLIQIVREKIAKRNSGNSK